VRDVYVVPKYLVFTLNKFSKDWPKCEIRFVCFCCRDAFLQHCEQVFTKFLTTIVGVSVPFPKSYHDLQH